MKAFLSQRFVPVGLLIMTAISTTISPPAAAAVTSSGDDAPIDFADRTVIQSCDDLDGLQVKNLILVRGGLICEGAKKKVLRVDDGFAEVAFVSEMPIRTKGVTFEVQADKKMLFVAPAAEFQGADEGDDNGIFIVDGVLSFDVDDVEYKPISGTTREDLHRLLRMGSSAYVEKFYASELYFTDNAILAVADERKAHAVSLAISLAQAEASADDLAQTFGAILSGENDKASTRRQEQQQQQQRKTKKTTNKMMKKKKKKNERPKQENQEPLTSKPLPPSTTTTSIGPNAGTSDTPDEHHKSSDGGERPAPLQDRPEELQGRSQEQQDRPEEQQRQDKERALATCPLPYSETTSTAEADTGANEVCHNHQTWQGGVAPAQSMASPHNGVGDGEGVITEVAPAMVKVKTFLRGWRPRELSLNGSTLRQCVVKRGRTTASCKEMLLDESSEIVQLHETKKGKTGKKTTRRSAFRVMTGAPRGKKNPMWVVDAGSPDNLDKIVAAVNDVINQSHAHDEMADAMDGEPRAQNAGDHFFLGYQELGPNGFEVPAFRGSSLSPGDYPLKTRQFMSTLPKFDSANLEVTNIGDVVLRRGDLPAYSNDQPPLWAHRATGSVGGRANGGILCAVESWWGRFIEGREADIPVHLVVKNGRWRVRRGMLCTLGESPRPRGSWRVLLPWDKRGREVRTASLQILESHDLVVASAGGEVMWTSSSEGLTRVAEGTDSVFPS